jgi:hypothetical protein
MWMTHRIPLAIACCLGALLLACRGRATTEVPRKSGLVTVCAGTGFPGVAVQIRRPDGRPIAPGAKLVVRDGAYRDSVIEAWSPLMLGAAENRAGTYTVEVSKPFYRTVTIKNVSVPGGPCGAYHTVSVAVTLDPLPGAPAIRSVSVIPAGSGLGSGLNEQFTVYVDADPGSDTSVTWSLSDPRPARIDSVGMLTALCATKTDILVVATSRRDPARRGIGRLGVIGSPCP